MKFPELRANPKLILEFKRYLQKKALQDFVMKIRQGMGIPKNGYAHTEEFTARFLENVDDTDKMLEDVKTLEASVDNLEKFFNIPFYAHTLLMGYLVLGDNYLEFDLYSPLQDFGCAMQIKEGSWFLRIHPRAKVADVVGFIKKNWKMLTKSWEAFEDNEMQQVRVRKNESRDLKILSYYKMGIFHYNGTTNVKELKRANPKFTSIKEFDPTLRGLEIANIKKIIQTQKKRVDRTDMHLGKNSDADKSRVNKSKIKKYLAFLSEISS